MHLGLNGYAEADWPFVQDLGVTYIKWAFELEHTPIDQIERHLEDIVAHKCIPVIDLRVEPADSIRLGTAISDRLWPKHEQTRWERFASRLRPRDCRPYTEEELECIRQRTEAIHAISTAQVEDWVLETVYRTKHLCRDWEVQGEWACPVVSAGFAKQWDYVQLLRRCYQAVHLADPGARVWLGGNAVNLDRSKLRAMLDPPPGPVLSPLGPEYKVTGQMFDVANLHHYGHTLSPDKPVPELATQIAGYDDFFREMRGLLRTFGTDQPFASTEWGQPFCPDSEAHKVYRSRAYHGGVPGIAESWGPEWFDACFGSFEKHGMRVLCVHSLHDLPEGQKHQFWGGFCGLLDLEGCKRPVWKTVQRWAWRARESGVPAFP